MTAVRGRRIVVPVGRRAVEYRDGAVARVLGPGPHRVRRAHTVVPVVVAERLRAVAPQEVVTAESVPVRVSMALRVRVTDPVAYLERAADPDAVVYLAAQVALREALGGIGIDDLARRTAAVDAESIRSRVDPTAEAVGVEVLTVVVKDVVLPAEIRSAAVDLITAKARGAARLEEARAETAALRALANAGRMLDGSPALARIRMIEAVPPGATIVLSDTGR
ncbi:SPFH domain-containing protein [Tsukamurella tyrosinosolvens]|uniref:SPFH domain-containing protein n=1 Tax=Tsukamurella tyrosinosolvens TaxID=57704 RepID=UPI001AF1886D|nr:SPFH domain-containing protein [Tsukamurella tyrosinosolvens]QRY82649.1 slipin family protein [Tsukamurella tyrosinosolvens]